jgi:PAS domain S-box-containing protein
VKGQVPGNVERPADKAISPQQLLEYARDLIAVYESEKAKRKALEAANRNLEREIVHRCKLERELVRSEAKYRSLFENATDAIFVTTRDGILLDANTAWLELFELDKEDFRGTNALGLFVDPARQTIFQNEVELSGSVKDFRLELRKSDGTVMNCVVTATVRRDKEGAVVGCQGIVRDMSEEIRSQEVLERARKMEALAHMAGEVAHEIRNPLAISSSAAQLLADDQLPCQLRQQCAEKIVSGINRASLIVENLLTFAQPLNPSEIRKVNLVVVVRAALKHLVDGALLDGVEVVTQFPSGPVSVPGHGQLLQRAFLNLLSNGLAATIQGATLRVEVEKNDVEAVVVICDSAGRMAEDTIEKIFDPFADAFSTARGSSLGLSVAYSVIDQHGGSIRVECSEDQGTRFRVSLPLSVPRRDQS